jgi:hypothetical protein
MQLSPSPSKLKLIPQARAILKKSSLLDSLAAPTPSHWDALRRRSDVQVSTNEETLT